MNDLERTRRLLDTLQAEQVALGVELDRLGKTSFVARSGWLIRHRTADERLAWTRHWTRLGLTDPEPRRHLSSVELIAEVDHLLACGMQAWEAAKAVDRSAVSLERLTRRYQRPELARMFARERGIAS